MVVRKRPRTAAVRLTEDEKAQLGALARLEGRSEHDLIHTRLFPWVGSRIRDRLDQTQPVGPGMAPGRRT